jgi:hypothetical protein
MIRLLVIFFGVALLFGLGCAAPETTAPPQAGVSLPRSETPPLPPMPVAPRMALAATAEVSSIETTPETNDFRVSIQLVELLSYYVYPQRIELKPWSGDVSTLTNIPPERHYELTNRFQRSFHFYAPTGNWSEYQWEESDGSGVWWKVGDSHFTNVIPRHFKATFAFNVTDTNESKGVRLRMIGYPSNTNVTVN